MEVSEIFKEIKSELESIATSNLRDRVKVLRKLSFDLQQKITPKLETCSYAFATLYDISKRMDFTGMSDDETIRRKSDEKFLSIQKDISNLVEWFHSLEKIERVSYIAFFPFATVQNPTLSLLETGFKGSLVQSNVPIDGMTRGEYIYVPFRELEICIDLLSNYGFNPNGDGKDSQGRLECDWVQHLLDSNLVSFPYERLWFLFQDSKPWGFLAMEHYENERLWTWLKSLKTNSNMSYLLVTHIETGEAEDMMVVEKYAKSQDLFIAISCGGIDPYDNESSFFRLFMNRFGL